MLFKKTIISSTNVAVGNYTITTQGVLEWATLGPTLTLPYVGHYQIACRFALTELNGNALYDNHWLQGRFYDTSASAVVAGSYAYLHSSENIAQNADNLPRSGDIAFAYRTTTPTVLSLQINQHQATTTYGLEGTYSNMSFINIR